jgi:hypothetical protein
MNFQPKMNYGKLVSGYKKVLDTIYAPKYYYSRVATYMAKMKNTKGEKAQIQMNGIVAFIKSIFILGIFGKERRWYWKLLFHTLIHDPAHIASAVSFAICGYHFRRIYKI